MATPFAPTNMDPADPTRRGFLRASAGSLAAATIAAWPSARGFASEPPAAARAPEPYRQDKPLLELQQSFLDLRLGMFLHFNMATFQDREWGDPEGPTEAFDPSSLDTNQWADAALSAGMKYGCLTTKHHDGFCIWPTKSGGDSVLKTPRKIDVVRAYVDSFRSRGLSVGLYYSILDLRGDIRHHNVTPAKVSRIKAELTELLTGYGDINVLIFDGWDAPWSRISYEEVPFHEIYALVKRLQPDCLISELNASQYPPTALFYTDIKAFEQNAGQKLPIESAIPSQSCVTLTDGWFWKQGDESRPLKPADVVVNQWLKPQNERHCNLICNAAPNREGRLAPNIVARLEEIGKLWKRPGPAPKIASCMVITTPNLALGRPIRACASDDTYGPDFMNDGDFHNSWYLPAGRREGWIEIDTSASGLKPGVSAGGPGPFFNTITIAEPVGRWKDYGRSRIEKYLVQAWDGRGWSQLCSGQQPDPVRMLAIPRIATTKVRFSIWAAADQPHISEIGLYDEPRRA